jgi:hypothetical protein
MQATIVTNETRTVDAVVDGDRLLIDPEALPAALDWELKPEGLCRENVCVPVRDRESLFVGARLDVRRAALRDHHAPAFTLADLDGVEHSLAEWRGTKKLLVAFASW